MIQLNQIQLQGVIGKAEPFTVNDVKAVRLNIAVDRSYKAKDGSKVKETVWFPTTVFSRKGFPAVEDLTVGKMVNLTGRLRNRRFARPDGSEGSAWDIVPAKVTFDIPEDKKNVQYGIVHLRGRIGNVRLTQVGDKKQATFSVATDYVLKDAGNNISIETTWHQVVIWENKGVKDLSLLAKGMAVEVDGRVRDYKYTGTDGNDHYVHEILAINWNEVEAA